MIKIPEDRQAGAEIEVTPKMIEAGVAALGKFENYLDLDIFTERRVIMSVLAASLEASAGSHKGRL